MIGRYWLGRPVAADYEVLLAGARDDRARALVELVYGQLLVARKRPGALAHLEAGFRLARPWLSAQEYLAVMRRHQQLGRLYPAAGTAPPAHPGGSAHRGADHRAAGRARPASQPARQSG